MAHAVKQTKDARLQIRMEPSDMEELAAWMREMNLNPRRDTSRLMRALVRGRNKATFLSDSALDSLKFHFTNLARIGGLLNQVVYNLNVERLRYEEGEVEALSLRPEELTRMYRDLHAEVVELKKVMLKLAAQRVD